MFIASYCMTSPIHRLGTGLVVVRPTPFLPPFSVACATPLSHISTPVLRASSSPADDAFRPSPRAMSGIRGGSSLDMRSPALRAGRMNRALPGAVSLSLPTRRMFISSTMTRRKSLFSRGSRPRTIGMISGLIGRCQAENFDRRSLPVDDEELEARGTEEVLGR